MAANWSIYASCMNSIKPLSGRQNSRLSVAVRSHPRPRVCAKKARFSAQIQRRGQVTSCAVVVVQPHLSFGQEVKIAVTNQRLAHFLLVDNHPDRHGIVLFTLVNERVIRGRTLIGSSENIAEETVIPVAGSDFAHTTRDHIGESERRDGAPLAG